VGLRYNPPPGWPPAPEGFSPSPGWQPDPSWPPPPPGWQLWVNDDQAPTRVSSQQTIQAGPPSPPRLPGDAAEASGGPYGGPGSPYGGPGGAYGGPGSSPYGDAANPYGGSASPYGGPTSPYGAPGRQYGGAGGPYGTPYGGYGNPYAQPGQPYNRKTSGWAIASFVLGLLGGVLLSVIFAFIALSRIKRLGQQGRGLAIAGLILSGIWVLLIILIVVVASLNGATRSSSTGKITGSGNLSVFSLAVGDCFNSPADTQDVASVTAEPCNQPHSAQIYAKFNLAGSNFSYPGTATVTRLAASGCTVRTGSIDRSKTTNAMTVRFLFPDRDAWLGRQRTVACMIVNPTANLTYSLVNP
jgi:Domain of unknown function (DUF4190)/Septum formation